MRSTANEKCKTCQYRAAEQDANNCDYYLITNKRRGCPADNCDKYVKGPKIRLCNHMEAEIKVGHLHNYGGIYDER